MIETKIGSVSLRYGTKEQINGNKEYFYDKELVLQVERNENDEITYKLFMVAKEKENGETEEKTVLKEIPFSKDVINLLRVKSDSEGSLYKEFIIGQDSSTIDINANEGSGPSQLRLKTSADFNETINQYAVSCFIVIDPKTLQINNPNGINEKTIGMKVIYDKEDNQYYKLETFSGDIYVDRFGRIGRINNMTNGVNLGSKYEKFRYINPRFEASSYEIINQINNNSSTEILLNNTSYIHEINPYSRTDSDGNSLKGFNEIIIESNVNNIVDQNNNPIEMTSADPISARYLNKNKGVLIFNGEKTSAVKITVSFFEDGDQKRKKSYYLDGSKAYRYEIGENEKQVFFEEINKDFPQVPEDKKEYSTADKDLLFGNNQETKDNSVGESNIVLADGNKKFAVQVKGIKNSKNLSATYDIDLIKYTCYNIEVEYNVIIHGSDNKNKYAVGKANFGIAPDKDNENCSVIVGDSIDYQSFTDENNFSYPEISIVNGKTLRISYTKTDNTEENMASEGYELYFNGNIKVLLAVYNKDNFKK